MLKTVDILLGLTVVMLIASMAVTVLTQFVTNLLNSRGKHLARGLGDLLQQIDPQLEREVADQISLAVLTHPLISHLQGIPLLGTQLGDTIHREELTKLLMDMAAGQSFGLDQIQFPDAAKARLKRLLKNNGIEDPAATLDNVRACALQMEQANPDMAADVRHSIALMQKANSRFVAKINSWFDQTIDRVSDRFTASTRIVTVLCSIVVVAAVQLDTIDLMNRLSMDDKLREILVAKAIEMNAAEAQKPVDSSKINTETAAEPHSKTDGNANIQAVKNNLKALQDMGVINIYSRGAVSWLQHWREVNPIGILLSVVLVSLGAPFWYGVMKNLLKLRSVLAGKDDDQRSKRQSTQQPKPEALQRDSDRVGGRGTLGGEAV